MAILQNRTLSSYGGQYIIESERERFELFSALISPLKELESYTDSRDAAMRHIAQSKSKLESPILTILIGAVLYTVAFAIPFLAVFYIVVNLVDLPNGSSLFDAYKNWVDTTPLSYHVLDFFANLMKGDGFLSAIIPVLLSLAFLYLIVPCVYFEFPIVLVFCIISTIISRATARKELQENLERCKEMEGRIAALTDLLILPLEHVPYDYRYSEALEHFWNSYINGKANTLKEAIDIYETYQHRKKMEHAQEVLHADQTKIYEEIQQQNARLDDLQDSVRRVKNKVDWL